MNKMESEVMGSKLIRCMFNLLIKKIVKEYLDGCHVIIWLSSTQAVSLCIGIGLIVQCYQM